MINVKYFTIMAEKDQSEGRGGLGDTGINFSNYADALSFTKTNEMKEYKEYTVMDYYVRDEGHRELIKERNVVIFDSLLECAEHNKNKLRENALAKLTKEEKHVLGLL